jgi:hypothetical protein
VRSAFSLLVRPISKKNNAQKRDNSFVWKSIIGKFISKTIRDIQSLIQSTLKYKVLINYSSIMNELYPKQKIKVVAFSVIILVISDYTRVTIDSKYGNKRLIIIL